MRVKEKLCRNMDFAANKKHIMDGHHEQWQSSKYNAHNFQTEESMARTRVWER